jgi:hypothetical protein
MTIRTVLVAMFAMLVGAVTAQAQMRQPGGGAREVIQKYFEQIGMPKEFAANVEMQSQGMTMASKMAVKGEKSRMEMTSGPMGQMVIISDRPAKKTYMLFPASKSYMEMPVMEKKDDKAGEKKVTVKELGDEQKEGQQCAKRLITIAGEGQEPATEITVWIAKDIKLPVRLETSTGGQMMAMVYKDYDLKSPDDALFQVPADYKKQAGFGGMMPMPTPGAGDDK